MNAGQVDLTPLFMCNLLNRLSICPVKGRASLKGEALTILETVSCYAHRYISGTSVFQLLNNMPLNLAYGPTSRWHHMEDKFDPNVDTQTLVSDERHS